jgi:HAE1 family hydrophobic/amphiphilic exporter-1
MGASDDAATINIDLVSVEERERSSDEVAQEMRSLTRDIAGAEIECTSSSNSMGSYSSSGVELQLYGDDNDTLKSITDQYVQKMETIPGLVDVKSSYEDGEPQTTIRINRDKAYGYGITTSSIASMLRTAVTGLTPTTYKIDDTEYDIRVMYDSDNINYLEDVENILIPTAQGGSIPLSEIAEITNEDVPVSITREDQAKYATVTANLENLSTGKATSAIEEAIKDVVLPDDYYYKFGGTSEKMTEAFTNLALALILAVFLVYMVMAAEFEAFSFPAIVMFSIPIAVTGGLFGCFVMGQSISITSFLGLIMLAGVVINNAIVLIDYTNLLIRERDMTAFDALEVAGPTRLRPILMSSLTTVLGMLPMMLSQDSGSESMRGLATVVVFGLTLSTLVTLLLVPAVYLGFKNMQDRSKAKKEAKKLKKLKKA